MGETVPTVVVGVSCSEGSMRALHWAASVATREGDRLVCVTVEQTYAPQTLYAGIPSLSFGESSIVTAAEAISSLASMAGAAERRGADGSALATLPDTAYVSVAGDVACGLEAVARERGARLLVIGASSPLPRWRGRTVADRVLASPPCPVVVVP